MYNGLFHMSCNITNVVNQNITLRNNDDDDYIVIVVVTTNWNAYFNPLAVLALATDFSNVLQFLSMFTCTCDLKILPCMSTKYDSAEYTEIVADQDITGRMVAFLNILSSVHPSVMGPKRGTQCLRNFLHCTKSFSMKETLNTLGLILLV